MILLQQDRKHCGTPGIYLKAEDPAKEILHQDQNPGQCIIPGMSHRSRQRGPQ